jgi:hypothetical protein
VSINTNGREMRPHLVSAEDYAAQVNSEEHTAHVFASSPERLKTLQRARREELAGFTPLVKYDMGPLARGAGAYNRARWSPHPGRKKERDATINATLHGAKKGVMPASNKTVAAASQSWFADAQDLRDHHNKFVPRGRAKQTPPWRGRKTKMRLEVRTEQLNNKFNDGSDWRGRATTEATLTDRLISRSPSGQPPRKKARTER